MKKRITALLCALIFLLPSVSFARSFVATRNDVIFGAALSDNQKSQVMQAFGLDFNQDLNFGTAYGSDLNKYLGYSTADSNMISSVYIKRLEGNAGIRVNIVTPANITQITSGQYTNAAITAGITDAEIYVASPTPVTGESALVGVYKSLEERGQVVDVKRAQVAQDELKAVNQIAKEKENDANFDTKEFDLLIIIIKQKLAEHKEETGQSANAEELAIIIQNAINELNMENVLSDNNINILVNFFNKYQQTDAVDSEEVRENLMKFGNELADSANKFYAENKDSIDSVVKEAQDSGLLDSIVEFLNSLINSLMNLFASSSDNNN